MSQVVEVILRISRLDLTANLGLLVDVSLAAEAGIGLFWKNTHLD